MAVLSMLGHKVDDRAWTDPDPPRAIARELTFSLENPGSILTCVNRARNNARSIRGTISQVMWRAINGLYWQLRDPEVEAAAERSPHDLYQAVESGVRLLQGACDTTLPRDETWWFIKAGRMLERAEKTCRILETQTRALAAEQDPSVVNLEWAGVLRCCEAIETFSRLHASRVDRDRTLEFLLFDRHFPRSVRFCFEKLNEAQGVIGIDQPAGELESIIGRTLAELRYPDLDQVRRDPTAFTANLLQRCGTVGKRIAERYFSL
jgi:uncharacterized alpha-E superfamily protein